MLGRFVRQTPAETLLCRLVAILFWGMAGYAWYALDFPDPTVVYISPDFHQNAAMGNGNWADYALIGCFALVGVGTYVASYYPPKVPSALRFDRDSEAS